jgi:hypothetical protein
MPLGARQPLSRSAIVANENFFSHAKEVIRGGVALAKRCFRLAGNRLFAGQRKKRLATPIPVSTMRLESLPCYEHDDLETFVDCRFHSIGIGPLRLCRE